MHIYRCVSNTYLSIRLKTLWRAVVALTILPILSLQAAHALTQIEAENFILDTYLVENNEFASGGKFISLLDASGDTGTASTEFRGSRGVYSVVVNYLDEDDGIANLDLLVNGITKASWVLSQELDTAGPTEKAFTARTISGVKLQRGDTLTIAGTRHAGENARVDFIQLIREATIFEAEHALSSPNFAVASNHLGFTGAGFVDFIGEGSVEWTIPSDNGGDYALKFRYALGSQIGGVRPLNILVNEELAVSSLRFPNTDRFTTWKTADVIVRLAAGNNSIRVETTGSSGANIDHLTATPLRFLTEGGRLAPKADAAVPECNPGGNPDPGYFNTYYGKVDSGCDRSTLAGFRQVNGFVGSSFVDNAKFINAGDLGFGRNMFCLDNGRAACYVDNYLDPKGKSQLVATVAMERMNFSGRTIVAFFVYDKDGNRINEIPDGHRLNQLALDSEGPKSVPESCYACHFGFTTAGGNPSGGQYLPFDVDSFEDWPGKPTRTAQKEAFRRLNRLIWSDAGVGDRKLSVKQLVEGWYDGPPFFDTVFNANHLPKASWYTNPNPLGCATRPLPVACARFFRERFLYKNVYAKFCRSCHVAQGPAQDVNKNFDGIDWQKGAVFEDQAYYHICDLRSSITMPHAEVTFDKFNNDKINFTNGEVATAKERLCATKPKGFVSRSSANKANGKVRFNNTCAGCHTVEGFGYPDPDLTCKGARVFKELGEVDVAMSGVSLPNGQAVADMRAYLNSFDQCPPPIKNLGKPGDFGT